MRAERLSRTVAGLVWVGLALQLAPWLVRGLSRGDGPVQAVLAGVAAILLLRGRERWVDDGQRPWFAYLLAIGSPLLGAIALRFAHVELLAALSVVGSLLGIVGLWLGRRSFFRAVPIALLVCLLLPVRDHLDVIVGFSLRKLTATGAAWLLGLFGAAPIATETVLRLEGAVAHVDLPCAGMRSLWSLGVVALLGAVALGRSIDGRMVAAGVGALAVLIGANTVRVAIVVGLQHIVGWKLMADVVHQPLGAVGFIVAFAVFAFLSGTHAQVLPPDVYRKDGSHAGVLSTALATVALVALTTSLAKPAASVAPAPVITLPATMSQRAPTQEEQAFADSHGATVTKGTFPGGSVVLVASRSWAAHHVPRMCLEANGFTLSEDRPAYVDAQAVRVARARQGTWDATALWWLQAAHRSTDDHVVRIREGFFSDEPWVLVSVLFDGNVEPNDLVVEELVKTLRARVARELEET